jgi:hypothetical protein
MRANYAGDKRRRELAAKQKKEAKAAKIAERKALKAQYPDGIPPELAGEDADADEEPDENPAP